MSATIDSIDPERYASAHGVVMTVAEQCLIVELRKLAPAVEESLTIRPEERARIAALLGASKREARRHDREVRRGH